jgi:microcystin-dependent protein
LDASGYEHDVVHTNHSGAIIALETKLGSTDSNPSDGAVLVGTGSGTSAWDTTPTFNGVAPTGVVAMWSGSSAPTGWLECDGSAVSRTTYSGLFAIIGTRYGTGDGSSTFNLPNPVDRVAMGIALSTTPSATTLAGSSSLDALGLGNQSANHAHNGTSGNQSANHSHNANTSNTGNHNHNTGNPSSNHTHSYNKGNTAANTGNVSSWHTHNISNTGAHSHNVSVGNNSANHTHNVTTGNQSASHNHSLSSATVSTTVNVEPFGFIIKT